MYVFAKHISKLFQTFWNHLISRIELQNDFWEYSNVATSIQTQLRAFVSRKKCRPIIETCRLKFRFYGIEITDSRNINFFRFWTLLTVQVLNSEFKFESSVKIYLEKWYFNAVLALLRPYFWIKSRKSDFEKQPFLPFWPFSSTKYEILSSDSDSTWKFNPKKVYLGPF